MIRAFVCLSTGLIVILDNIPASADGIGNNIIHNGRSFISLGPFEPAYLKFMGGDADRWTKGFDPKNTEAFVRETQTVLGSLYTTFNDTLELLRSDRVSDAADAEVKTALAAIITQSPVAMSHEYAAALVDARRDNVATVFKGFPVPHAHLLEPLIVANDHIDQEIEKHDKLLTETRLLYDSFLNSIKVLQKLYAAISNVRDYLDAVDEFLAIEDPLAYMAKREANSRGDMRNEVESMLKESGDAERRRAEIERELLEQEATGKRKTPTKERNAKHKEAQRAAARVRANEKAAAKEKAAASAEREEAERRAKERRDSEAARAAREVAYDAELARRREELAAAAAHAEHRATENRDLEEADKLQAAARDAQETRDLEEARARRAAAYRAEMERRREGLAAARRDEFTRMQDELTKWSDDAQRVAQQHFDAQRAKEPALDRVQPFSLFANSRYSRSAYHFLCPSCKKNEVTHQLFPCGHTFCNACVPMMQDPVNAWICPVCRGKVDTVYKLGL